MSGLACVVVFCTVYALILPAITMENKPQCGKEEHTHTDECYRRLGAAAAPAQPVLDCTLNSLGIHQHTADCYDAGGALICGYADYVLHIHDGRCYDETGALVCTLPEIREHVHTDACYRAAEPEPVQDPQPAREPICGKQEAEGHTHTDACYQTERELTCTLPETEGHVHGEACRDETGTLICTLTEAEGHTHNDSCYTEKKTLICTVEESEGHTHTEACYPAAPEQAAEQLQPQEQATEQEQARELICAIPEAALHTHDETCYTGGVLTCGRLQTTAHQHTDACFHAPEAAPAPQPELTCTIPEGEGAHTHSQEAGCYDENGKLICETEESAGHQHGPRCYGTWELVCQLEEHTHAEECFLKDGLTAEEWAQIDAVSAKLNALPIRGEIEEKLMALDVAGDEAGYDAYMIQLAQAVREARAAYDALTETQKQKIADAARLEELSWLLTSADDSGDTIEPVLDGDYAYIANLIIKSCADGAGDFDEDNAPGNDSSASNLRLRTFDLATYTLGFTIELKEGANPAGYREGKVFFECVLPVTADKAAFDLGGMTWLQTVKDPSCQITEANGRQVLSGSYVLEPSGANPAAISSGYSEITVAVRALNMQNGDTLAPQFTMWLDYNGEVDHETVSNTLTISAASQYNVELVRPFTSNTATGDYNFATDDAGAPNTGMGTVNGYMMGFGLSIQLRSDKNRGLLGMQLPGPNTTISFDLTLSSAYVAEGIEVNTEGEYPLLLWSGGGNSEGDAQGRPTQTAATAIVDVPYNQYQASSGPYGGNACNDGGTWTFSQEGDTIHVTVTGFQIDTSRFPYRSSQQTFNKYYTPKEDGSTDWLNINAAVFSAGEFWLLQPCKGITNGQQVDKIHGPGQFNITVRDTDLTVNGAATAQTKADDDASLDYRLGGGGTIAAALTHNKEGNTEYNGSLLQGSHLNDTDWAVAGQPILLRAQLSQTGANGGGVMAAADLLVKFDARFFEPYSVKGIQWYANDYGKFYWAAKPDKTNWTSDEEMKRATEDDLVYFASGDLDSLKAQGYVPVGVLMEVRNGDYTATNGTYSLRIDGKVKEDSDGGGAGMVYMMTQSNLVWTKNDVANALGISNVSEMTAEQCNNYVRNTLPSRDPATGGSKQQLDGAGNWLTTSGYIEPSERQDYFTTSQLRTCSKPTYDEGGYHPGLYAVNFQDSCLVVPYRTTITKTTAQTDGNGNAKVAYGMNQNQRMVDYVLTPKIQGELAVGLSDATERVVEIIIQDTLPKGLLYYTGSSYIGGSYTQDTTCENPGTVTGGRSLEPSIETAVDGRTVLTWRYTATVSLSGQNPTPLEPIYFSCQIDNAELASATVSLTNQVTITTGGEQFRGFKEEYGNLGKFAITVTRMEGASITKLSDQHNADWWKPLGFLMNAGNNSSENLNDVLIVETLPKNGQDDTGYDGPLVVDELLLGSKANTPLLGNFQFYYTTDTAYAGLTGANLRARLAKQDGQTWQQYLAASSSWQKLTAPTNVQSTTTQGAIWYAGAASGLPNTDSQKTAPITAIVAAGTLPANRTLKMHITVSLPQGKAGDKLVNHLSMLTADGINLHTSARTELVSRSLAGLTWLDKNADGIQNETEADYLSGITVSLLKLKEGTDPTNLNNYEPCCYPGTTTPIVIQTGQQVSAQAEGSGKIASYNKGEYLFTDLPSGVYAVKFSDGTGENGILLENYHPSPENEGTDDAVDSDGVPTLDGDHVLQSTAIVNIDLQDASGISVSEHNDSGFYRRGTELPMTGGSGAYWQTFCGLALMAGPLVCWTHKRRRGAERR